MNSTMSCRRCDAACCRLLVHIEEGERIPPHLTATTEFGALVMARDDDGWCLAIDPSRMDCSIYATRPQVCRDFRLGGAACLQARDDLRRHHGSVPHADEI